MGCNNCGNISDTCGDKYYAPCVYLENDFPECSGLHGEECVTLDTMVDDVYQILCDLSIDLSEFEINCIDYNDNLTIDNILQVHNVEICNVKQDVEDLHNVCTILSYNIEDCDLDYSCLEGQDPCGEVIAISTLLDLLQTLIRKVCALEQG